MPRDAPEPKWMGVQIPMKTNTVELPCLSQPHIRTLLSQWCPTNEQLKVYVNLYNSPRDVQVRNTSWRTWGGSCAVTEQVWTLLNISLQWHHKMTRHSQQSIQIKERLKQKEDNAVFQKQQVLPEPNDKSHFNSQCLYCYLFRRWLRFKDTGRIISSDKYESYNDLEQVSLKYDLILEEI